MSEGAMIVSAPPWTQLHPIKVTCLSFPMASMTKLWYDVAPSLTANVLSPIMRWALGSISVSNLILSIRTSTKLFSDGVNVNELPINVKRSFVSLPLAWPTLAYKEDPFNAWLFSKVQWRTAIKSLELT